MNCRVGPCDVTSKSDLEKLIIEISSKEKYLNLLGIPLPLEPSPHHVLTISSPSHQRRHLRPQSTPRLNLRHRNPRPNLEQRECRRLAIRPPNQRHRRLLLHPRLSPSAPSLYRSLGSLSSPLPFRHRHLQHERDNATLSRPFRV